MVEPAAGWRCMRPTSTIGRRLASRPLALPWSMLRSLPRSLASSSRLPRSPDRRRCGPALALWVALIGAGLVVPATAQVVVEASLGFDGVVPLGRPTPVTLRVTNRGGEPFLGAVTVRASDFLSGWAPIVGRPLEVSAGVSRQVSLLVEGARTRELEVVVESRERVDLEGRSGSGPVVSEPVARQLVLPLETAEVADSVRLVLVLGPRGRQLARAIPSKHPTLDSTLLFLGEEDARVAALDAPLAPDSGLGYAGVDLILWTEPDVAAMPNPSQLRALKDWVRRGGRLVLLAAPSAPLLDAAPLAPLVPLLDLETEMRAYPSPRGAAAGSFAVDGPVLVGRPAPGASARSGRLDFAGGDLPGPVIRSMGLGLVALACFDPLAYDLGDPATLVDAVAAASGEPLRYRRDEARAEQLGLPELLRAREDDPMDGTRFHVLLGNQNALTPSLGMFTLLAVLFVILIGPVDYRLLKKRGKLHWSPWTLLAYTVVFSGASVGATFLLFAPEAEVNRIAFLDVLQDEDGADEVAGVVYHGVYSPTAADFTPRMPGFECFGVEVAAPSRALFGGGGRSASPQLCLGPGAQPLALEMGFNSLRVTGHLLSGHPDGGLTARVSDDGAPAVTIHNGFASDLREAVIVTSDGVLALGTLAAGETRTTALHGFDRRTLGEVSSYSPEGARRDGTIPPPFARRLIAETVLHTSAPWSLAEVVRRGDAILIGVIDELPFDDGLADRRSGFNWVFVRRAFSYRRP